MLTGVHFLLTYKCTFECDHCFLFCGPNAEGVFTIDHVQNVLGQMKETGTIDTAYFEGGEPFLYYPLMVESLRLAKSMGFKAGVVTNAYWAESDRDAELWLKPLADIGIDDLSVSDDDFHYPDGGETSAARAAKAAKNLGIPCGAICIDAPKVVTDDKKWKGEPVVGGDVLFKGRAVDKLDSNLPRRMYSVFDECPHEDFEDPGRIHLDPFGYVHACQGIVIGNVWKTPLKEIMEKYDPESHPIIGPLIKGGPAELARKFNFDITSGFIDHCHLCFEIRRGLLDRFPDILTPKLVYGVEDR
ncbi:MAG: radical SAM protein [candidate division Zixibacteria bacterium]